MPDEHDEHDEHDLTIDDDGRTTVQFADGMSISVTPDAALEIRMELGATDLLNLEATDLLEAGDLDTALQLLERAAAQEPDHHDTLANLALVHQALGHTDVALTCVRRLLGLAPRRATAHARLGRILYDTGAYEAASAAMATALSIESVPDLLFDLGKCALRRERWAEAEQFLTRDIEEDEPGDISFWDRHIARRKLGKNELALTDLAEAIARCSDDETLWSMMQAMSDLLIEQDDEAGAVATLRQAADRFPKDPAVHIALGQLLMEVGDVERADAALSRAVALDPDDPGYLAVRGVARFGAGQVQTALADFDRAVELDPQNPQLVGNRGYLRQQHGDAVGAEQDYRKALALDPDYGPARANLDALLEPR